MSDLHTYLVEELVEDYRDGAVSRREFLRRMALLAGGVAAASARLAQMGLPFSSAEVAAAAQSAPESASREAVGRGPTAAPNGGPGALSEAPGITVPPDDPAIRVEEVRYRGKPGEILAYYARPRSADPVPGVLVIHENRGLVEHIKDVARRYAKVGYAAIAPDLASPGGGTARFTDLAEVSALLGRISPEDHTAELLAALTHLRGLPGVRRDRTAATGFCFGGGLCWRVATQDQQLRAASPYYGIAPPLADVPRIRAAVLGIYAGNDTRINQSIASLEAALRQANVTYKITIYPNVDHAFHNDTGRSHNEAAAKAAWQETLAWFERYVRG